MSKATARNVDFTNVKDGGNFNKARIPAGDYLAIVSKVEDAEAKDGTPQYLFSIKIEDRPSSVFPYYCKLQENQLWKLRNIMIAAGKAVPKRRTKVDPNSVVGKLIGVSVEDTEYQDKEQSEIAGVFPAAELGDIDVTINTDDDEDDAPVAAGYDEEPEEDEVEEAEEADDEVEEEEAGDSYDSMNRAQLKAEIVKFQADFQARKSQSDDDLRTILRGLASKGVEEDDEEEEEAPAPKKAARKAPAKTAKAKVEEISDDELDELDIDSL